jgi:hypothetical protein
MHACSTAPVTVFDFPFGGTAQDAYVRSGIKEQVEAAGGKMEIMSNLKYVSMQIPNAQVMSSTRPIRMPWMQTF